MYDVNELIFASMSGSSKSLLVVLQRCVGVRQLTTGIRARCRGFSDRSGPIQRFVWTPTTRAGFLQRPSQCSIIKTSTYSFCTKVSDTHVDC